jgi:hypothetical protein
MDAYVTRTGHACFGVIDEDRLPGSNVQAGADELVDARIGLAEPGLMRIDDLLNQVLEPVCRLFPFPGADKAVAHDPGAIPRAQPAGVLNQLGIGGAEILAPAVGHVLGELLAVKPEAVPKGLVHVIEGDRADAAVPPDVTHALENLPGRQPEPVLPHAVHAKIRGYLEDAANVEYHRMNHHDGASSAPPLPAAHATSGPKGKVKP